MMTACGNKDKGGETTHVHTYSTEWTTNETHHWHTATCEHADEKGSYGEHTVATWTVKTEAGLHVDKVEQGTCTVCEKVVERTVPNTATHTYSTTWSKNETQHWKESTCEGHTPALKSAIADHTFGAWETKTPADYGVNRVEKHTCTVCGFEAEREVENSALVPKTNNVSVATINFNYSGKNQSIDSLITADNSTGIVIEYEGINGTTYAKSKIAPTNAGNYKYTITIPATAEWVKGEKTGTFEIKKYKVTCPAIFVTELSQGQEKTTKLCEIDLTDDENINLDEVELVYSNPDKLEGCGVGRVNLPSNRIKVHPDFADNIEVVGLPNNNQYIQWIVLDGNDTFSLRYDETITAGSCYKGTITHGFVKVGDKLTVLDYNSSTNRLVKVGVTVTQIEYLTNPYDTNKVYKTTSYATKGDTIKITFTKDNASDNISSVRNIVSAQEVSEINQNAGYKSQTVDLSLTGSEFRMLKIKINTNTKCKLTISDAENSKLLKVFNATTGAEITITEEGNFKVAEGTDVYIIIQQGTTTGTQQVKVELVEYTFDA